jgi:hypothetical protein
MRFRACVLSLVGLCAACEWGEEGNGRRVTQTRNVAEVGEIGNFSPFNVDISQGDKFEVRVSIDSNLQRFVGTVVHGDMLRIEFDDRVSEMVSGPHVLITVPRVTAILNHGTGNVFAAWIEQDEDVELNVSGTGDLAFSGSVPEMTAALRGPGNLHLSGEAAFADIALEGTGDVDANDLTAAGAVVDVPGSGDVRLRVNGMVDAQVAGSGDVELTGDVQPGLFSETGSGHIRAH